MLRLHPSELTLTPDDIDETFGRIALRQTSRAQQHWTMPPAGQPRQSGKPNRPILRRGPQRLIRYAMTINNIPIRQPQQAVITSVDEDNNEPHREAAQPPARDNGHPVLLHSSHQRNDATAGLSTALPSRSMQLPFRLRPPVQMLDAHTVSNDQAQGSTSLTPQNHPPRFTRPASTRYVENGNEQRAQLPSVGSSANTPEMRGGGLASFARPRNLTHDTIYTPSPLNHIRRLSSQSRGSLAGLACASDIVQDTIHEPSPLDQTQRLTSSTQQLSPGDPTQPHSSPRNDYSMPNLKKCPAETPHSTGYPHRTHSKCLPSSEPRRGSGRHQPTIRSCSSGDGASFSAMGLSTSILEDPSNDLQMPSAIVETPSRQGRGSSNPHSEDGDASSARHFSDTPEGSRQCEQTSLRRRERGSGATNASAAYSWYGSLGSDTQFPGSENSQNDESCPQLDGTSASVHRLSPLPSLPYTRMQNDYTSSPPPSTRSRQLSRDHVAATIAARHDLQSPLDAHVKQPQQRLQQTPHTLLNFPTHASPTMSYVGGLPINRPNRDQDMPSGHPVHLGPGPDDGASHQQSSPEHRAYSLRNISRTVEYPRLEQRSSKNDPVSVSIHQSDAARHGRVQMQREVYERLQNAASPMQAGAARGIDMISSHDSAPRTHRSHDESNRARNHMAHDGERFNSGSSMGMHQPRQLSRGQTQDAVHAGPSRPLASQFSRQLSAESTRHRTPRVDEGGLDGPRARPRHDGPLSTLAAFESGSDTWRRYWQSPPVRGAPTATTRRHRRVRDEQVDQENAGEEELMRREEASVIARYGEEQQQRTTMNETPPRIGRVERRMME
ncbi:uncharacterized protein yc1106_08637 [Curvularia clavata]|uniref:Uncharacterized protein n=1 Tax=Curvularia clavata TaxID=95742 RepID=A0A9Q8ZJP9_CURCL|nr:uncharacterized protein yc1106_08637 [Curvularia clavata]